LSITAARIELHGADRLVDVDLCYMYMGDVTLGSVMD